MCIWMERIKNMLFLSISVVYGVIRSLKECQIFLGYLFSTRDQKAIIPSLCVAHEKK